MSSSSLIAALLFLLVGAAAGRALSLLAARIPRDTPIFAALDPCPHCAARPDFLGAVPILGYVLRHGRCPACGTRTTPRDMLIESVSAVGTVLLGLWLLGQPRLVVLLLLLYVGITATAIDLEHRIIPNRLLLAGATLIAAALVLAGPGDLPGALEGAALLFVVALILALLGRGGFGFGDVKYLALVGFALGPAVGIMALFAAVLCGGLYATALLVLRRAGRRDTIAFGPFIAIGSLAAPILTLLTTAPHGLF